MAKTLNIDAAPVKAELLSDAAAAQAIALEVILKLDKITALCFYLGWDDVGNHLTLARAALAVFER